MKMIAPTDIAFKTGSDKDSILVFVNTNHIGTMKNLDGWYSADFNYQEMNIRGKHIHLTDKESMKIKIANLINEKIALYEPFIKLKKLSRVTRKDVNACLIKIIEESDSLTKDDIIKLLKGVIV